MRVSPRMSPALSGLLNDVVYKEEAVEMSPEEASLLQEEIGNISKQIESDTADLGLVSKSLNRVLELTEDMNTAVDTNTTDNHTASLLLSEFASIYKDTLSQEFTYSKNLSNNPLEVKQVLTAGLQSAEKFIETLRKIAKKIWESLKAAWKWFVSKISQFVKYITSKFSVATEKQEDVIETLVRAEAATVVAKASIKDIDETLNKIKEETDRNNEVLEEAIIAAEKLMSNLNKEAEAIKRSINISTKRVELKGAKRVLFSMPEKPTKNEVIEFLEEVRDAQELEKHIISQVLSNQDLADSVIRFTIFRQARKVVFKDRVKDTNLNAIDLKDGNDRELISAIDFNREIEIDDLKEEMLKTLFDPRVQEYISHLVQKQIMGSATDTYRSAKELFKFAAEDKFFNDNKYVLNLYQDPNSEPVITNLSVDDSLKKATVSGGNLYGFGTATIDVSGEVSVKDTSVSDSNKYTKMAIDSIVGKNDISKYFGEKLTAVKGLDLKKDIESLSGYFGDAIKETDKFLKYFEESSSERLEKNGKVLINNMFILVQFLNKCNPGHVAKVANSAVMYYADMFDKLSTSVNKAVSSFNKNN